MRSLLASSRAHEAERLAVDGRAAIRIVADEDGTWLVVDAQTFRPIEWRSTVEGTGGAYDTAITRIEVYEWLPPTEANIGLLRSEVQHPGARVVADITIEGTDGPR
jgi:hypothetical protein